jgi:hypothetical protein
VRPEQLTGCEVVPLERTYGWLQEQQRAMSRGGLALAFRSSEYSGRLLLARRTPVIRVTTLSNVHLTPRAVEETILLEFRVLEAGIQEIQFRLPARLAKARMRVPALRQKTVTPVADGEPNRPMVLVKLELQDELMDVIRIVVEHDQLLTSEAHDAAIPVVETGEVEAQYVTLQNSSRDEVVTADQSGIEELTRTQTRWRALADLNVTQGYVVRSDAIFPRLAFQTKPRQAIETVAARIGLAETILVVDESGAYRASQQFRLENSSEQYLEVELPEGASLWTAHVACCADLRWTVAGIARRITSRVSVDPHAEHPCRAEPDDSAPSRIASLAEFSGRVPAGNQIRVPVGIPVVSGGTIVEGQ